MELSNYAFSFSRDTSTSLIYKNTELHFIVRNDTQDNTILILSELVMDRFSSDEQNELLLYLYMNKRKISTSRIFIYGMKIHSLKFFKPDMKFSKVFRFINYLDDYVPNSKLNRKIHKSFKNYRFSTFADKPTIMEALNLSKHMIYFKNQENTKLVSFFLGDNSISLIAYYNESIVGAMFGYLFDDTIYMLIHYYNRDYSQHYLNQGIYQSFIDECKARKVKKIDWGAVEKNNNGLIYMKKNFSTNIEEALIISF
ncbi:MAG: GNAT family N-acetyltransferase [Ignavibacteriales bacterium]|jgi:hypothetical protein|nr:MAG: GNAT family N-acetyltransferase [Ignavibacteriales bacterium]